MGLTLLFKFKYEFFRVISSTNFDENDAGDFIYTRNTEDNRNATFLV